MAYTLTDNRCEGNAIDVAFKGELYEEQMRGANASGKSNI